MSKRVVKILALGFVVRLFVALWAGFIGPTPGADLDAIGINGFASRVGETGFLEDWVIGYIPYTNILGIIYYHTINHIVVGNIISCLAWTLSALFFYRAVKFFVSSKNFAQKALIIYSFLPSSVFLTAVTLREPFQLLFINISIYSFLRIYIQNASRYWIVFILSLICAGSLHGGLFAFGLYFFTVGIIMHAALKKPRIAWTGIFVFGICALFLLIEGIILFSNVAYNLDDGIEKAIDVYQLGLLGVEARANYRASSDYDGVGQLFVFIPISILQYLFEPLPWRVETVSDFVLCIENILRGWLIFSIWRGCSIINTGPPKQQRALFFIALSYFVMEIIWSVGTINWGTAVRHHVPALGLLLIASYGAKSRDFKPLKNFHFSQHSNNSIIK